LPQPWDDAGRSLHALALDEARLYEEKVAQDLGARVFHDIFAQLADALTRADLHAQTQPAGRGLLAPRQFTRAYLDEVREATLVLLYRLLFLFYAEDRHLLPVRDARYHDYSVRRIREEVRDRVDAGAAFSGTVCQIWLRLQGVFELIDQGDDTIGMPAYNGGLFHRARAPLLERTKVPDKVMAPIIDALSRRTEEVLKGWINYRDLSVAHLGGIYERLLEYTLVHEVPAQGSDKDKPAPDRLVALPASLRARSRAATTRTTSWCTWCCANPWAFWPPSACRRSKSSCKSGAKKAPSTPPNGSCSTSSTRPARCSSARFVTRPWAAGTFWSRWSMTWPTARSKPAPPRACASPRSPGRRTWWSRAARGKAPCSRAWRTSAAASAPTPPRTAGRSMKRSSTTGTSCAA